MTYRTEAVFSSFDDDAPELHILGDLDYSSVDDFGVSYANFVEDLIIESRRYLQDDFGSTYFLKELKTFVLEDDEE